MTNNLTDFPQQELILGGQKSGKTRRAEELARMWLQSAAPRRAIYLATGQAWDAEMVQRIERHQRDRAVRVPGMPTQQAPHCLAQAIQQYSQPDTMLVVDCLTMWLTNWMMPMQGSDANQPQSEDWLGQRALFLDALSQCAGPVVIVGNEIGLGVIPMGAQVREFVDALGVLNQDVARLCERVTLMAAGLPLQLK